MYISIHSVFFNIDEHTHAEYIQEEGAEGETERDREEQEPSCHSQGSGCVQISLLHSSRGSRPGPSAD